MSLDRSTIFGRIDAEHTGALIRKGKGHINLFRQSPGGEGVVSRTGGRGSKIYVLSSEPKEHKSFIPVPEWEDQRAG